MSFSVPHLLVCLSVCVCTHNTHTHSYKTAHSIHQVSKLCTSARVQPLQATHSNTQARLHFAQVLTHTCFRTHASTHKHFNLALSHTEASPLHFAQVLTHTTHNTLSVWCHTCSNTQVLCISVMILPLVHRRNLALFSFKHTTLFRV
jgi:hypothetical protein